jgi:hypothetical protein
MATIADRIASKPQDAQDAKWSAVALEAGLANNIKPKDPTKKITGADVQIYYEEQATIAEQDTLIEVAKIHANESN